VRLLAAFSLALLLGCADETIDRTRWQQMPPEDRVLYVRTLLGEEQAKDAKGGRGKTYDRPAEEYVKRIDAAYERNDGRDVDEIFAELATK
jgi:hypothetical protein